MKYVDKNKSLKKDAILENGVTISAMFLPNTLVLKDVAEVEDYQNNLYLMLSFSKNGKELLSQIPSDEYSSMLHTFSFGMESIVSIKTAENEPVNPLTVVFQPTYKMGKSNDITIVFRRDEFLDAEAIRVSLKEFGLNAGLLDFTFNVPDINYIANINILNP